MKTTLKKKTSFFFLSLAILVLAVSAFWSVQNGLLNGKPSIVSAQQIGEELISDPWVPTQQIGEEPVCPACQQQPVSQPAPQTAEKTLTYDGGTCGDDAHGTTHSWWVKQYSDGSTDWVQDWGEQVGQCGVQAAQECRQENRGSECDWNTNRVYDFYWDTCKNDYVRYNYHPVEGQCGFSSQPQSQPEQPQQSQPQQVEVASCFVCDNTGYSDGQGRWRQGFNCGSSLPACQVNNSSTFGGCTGATEGAICEVKSAAPAPIVTQAPPQGAPLAPAPNQGCPTGTVQTISGSTIICLEQNQEQRQVVYAYGGSASSYSYSGGSNVTINQAAPAAPRVVTAAAPAATKVAAAKLVAVEELPKTGLPMLAWALSGFLPVGLGLRRFGYNKKSLKNSPTYLWQSREFSK